MLTDGENGDRILQEVSELCADLCQTLDVHNKFIEKIEAIEEAHEGEYSDQRSGWKQFTQSVKKLFTKRKESENVDKQKEQTYQDKIAALELKVKEFQDAEAAEALKAKEEAEAKAKLEAEAAATAEAAKKQAELEAQTTEVKELCDKLAKENRMTPAVRAVDEPIMLTLRATSPEALKSFMQKYEAAVVPLGITAGVDQQTGKLDPRSQIILDAEKFVKANAKEFAGLTPDQAVSRAIYLRSTGAITFESDKP